MRAGLDGVVASAQEAAAIRHRLGKRPLIVCPGVRFGDSASRAGDQQRIATPCEALKQGASLLVVGRPITEAANPREAAKQILHDMEAR